MNASNVRKDKYTALSQKYQVMLREHLTQGPRANLRAAQRLGREAVAMGLETLEVAMIHEGALVRVVLPGDWPGTREAIVRRAGTFFANAIAPIEEIHRSAVEDRSRKDQLDQTLRQGSMELAASKQQLKAEIALRKSAEDALKKSEQHYAQVLAQSRHMQEQLRLLSRQLLLAQEEERKKISRELHDVIAQTLTGINVRLATLKKEATSNTGGLERSIAHTQQLVEHSVEIVHRFARELRPAVLDDLGLIPALHAFMKNFRRDTGIHVSLSASAAVERMNGDQRTVLYRVAQEALTNISRHANASRADVEIRKLEGAFCMTIKDDGKGFRPGAVLHAKKGKRLGLLGMKERLEMIGGNFTTSSVLGKGTTVVAQIPIIEEQLEKVKDAKSGRKKTGI